MEFTCTLLNIKLIEIFKVKFCTNYEKFIHVVTNFREKSLSHIPQRTGTYTDTDTYTHKQNGACVRGNIFRVSYPVFLLSYEALVSSSRKFPHKAIKVVSLQQHYMLYCSMYDIY